MGACGIEVIIALFVALVAWLRKRFGAGTL